MAFATFPLLQPLKLLPPRQYYNAPRRPNNHQSHRLYLFQFSALSRSNEFRLGLRPRISERFSYATIASANVTGPAYDAFVSEGNEFKVEDSSESTTVAAQPTYVISWGLLWKLVSRHKQRLLLSILALVGCTISTLTMPIYSGRLFEVLIGRSPEPLLVLLGRIGVLYTLEPICTVIYIVNMNAIWEKVMSSLKAQIFQKVLIQKMEFFDRYKVGELTSLLTSDLGSLKNIVSENVSRDRGFRALSEIIGTICLLFVLSPQLAPILGFLMLLVSTIVAVYKRTTVNVFKAHGLAQAAIADCVNETFSAIRTVRSFNGEKHQMSKFVPKVLEYENSGIKLGYFKSINESLTRIAVYVALMALYYLGGSKVKTGELSVGTVASFIGYTFILTFAVQGLVNTFGDLRGAFAATERINSVLSGAEIDESLAYALEKEIEQKKRPGNDFDIFLINGSESKTQASGERFMSSLKSAGSVCSLAASGDICLEDVYFSYPLRPDVKVLNGVNLTLKCGSVTALVGPSGAGKSTIVQLLARFYEPTRGRITVAEEDLRTFDKSEWARVVSIVNQEPVLFSMSIAENIAYGLPDESVSHGDLIKAAKAANAHEFIIKLPQGYKTPVGERGGMLSGGQRQRIAIARALLKNAPILILDEVSFLYTFLKLYSTWGWIKVGNASDWFIQAYITDFYWCMLRTSKGQLQAMVGFSIMTWKATSALDTESERLVQSALKHLMKGRTTLVIAHRLSTVQSANQIALCSDGEIAELGTHSELLSKNGKYASLVGAQLSTQQLAFE